MLDYFLFIQALFFSLKSLYKKPGYNWPIMKDQPPQKSRKLLDQIRNAIRLKHYSYNSYSTEKTYVHWARRYILFHNKRHPAEMGAAEIEAFLTHLPKNENVSSSTQNQALNALPFLYRNVLQIDLAIPIHALRPGSALRGRLPVRVLAMRCRERAAEQKVLNSSSRPALETVISAL